MRYFLLINSCLSTFGPFFVFYKASSLSTSSSPSLSLLLLSSLVIYIICQLCKSLVLLIFSSFLGYLWVFHQLLHLLDVPSLLLILQLRLSTQLDSSGRVVACGFGWALAEVLALNVVPLFVQLKSGFENPPPLIYRSVLANIMLVSHIAFAAIVYIYSKRKGSYKRLVKALLFLHALILPICFGHVWSLADHLAPSSKAGLWQWVQEATGRGTDPYPPEGIGRAAFIRALLLAVTVGFSALLTRFLFTHGASNKPAGGVLVGYVVRAASRLRTGSKRIMEVGSTEENCGDDEDTMGCHE